MVLLVAMGLGISSCTHLKSLFPSKNKGQEHEHEQAKNTRVSPPAFPLQSHEHEQTKTPDVTDVLQDLISGKKISPIELEAPGKLIPRPIVKKQVYFKDVVPIIKAKCTSCHNPEGKGLMNFISYEDIAGRGAMFKYVIEKNLMPPWYVDPNTGPFRDDISLTLKEKALLLQWAHQGFPTRKNNRRISLWSKPKKVKSLKNKADYVISLPEKVTVPAEGTSFYKIFTIQTPFKEDKWIKEFKFIVKPKVVHHFDIYIMKASYNDNNNHLNFDYMAQAINYIANLARFKNTAADMQRYHEHVGVRLPRFSKLVLELHYETIGREVLDDYTQVYINFHKKKPKYETALYAYDQRQISIPPHTSNYKTEISYITKKQALLSGIHTHMHLRGKASSIFMTTSKGDKKRIFGLDPFTKTFERTYIFKTPLLVPKGSSIKCTNWFDNSTNNPSNPNPKKHLTYGPSIEDEMSICFFQWLIPIKKESSKYMFWEVLH